jgi:hypothetical protein
MKYRFIACLIFLVLADSNISYAQKSKGESILSGSIGLSIWNLLVGAAGASDSLKTASTPTFSLIYDYGLSEHFSIGASLAYNSFSITKPDHTFVGANGNLVYDQLKYKASRVNIAVRPLFHWGKNEIMDWHAGMRLGYSLWTTALETRDPYYSNTYDQTSGYSAQVLFGARTYFNEYLSLLFDIGIGAPYFASIGISMKL